MRCPACKTENPTEATRCVSCQGDLSRRRRRSVPEESDTPFSGRVGDRNLVALRAYHLGVVALIPGVGLLLGPLALLLCGLAQFQVRRSHHAGSINLANAAVLLGFLITLTNWLGLYLMVAGWQGP